MSSVNNGIDEKEIVQAILDVLKKDSTFTNDIGAAEQPGSSNRLSAGHFLSNMPDEELKDITMIDEDDICLVENPKNKEALMRLKKHMPAKTLTGHAGDRDKTFTMLRKIAALAATVDAVWEPTDMDFVKSLDIPITKSLPKTKEEYLMRPDLGIKMDDENLQVVRSQLQRKPDVQLVIGEGQSNPALVKGIPELLPALIQGLKFNGINYGTPIYVEYTRVGIGDLIAKEVDAKMVCVIIGERPGLINWSSLSCYMTYAPEIGIMESRRTAVTNISEAGTPPTEAGAYVADLIKAMLNKKTSGIDFVI